MTAATVLGRLVPHGAGRLLAAGAIVAASLAVATAPSGASPAARPLAGFGATLAAFARAHPEDRAGCADTTCYGPLVASLTPTYEFSFVTLDKGRVVGWSQAIRRGTPLLQAELQVDELFPGDATASEVTVIHRDQYGSSCAVYDIHSKELEHLFGRQAFGQDGGNVGVELATLRPDGLTTYNPRAIDLAIVMPQYADHGQNC